MRTPFPTIIEFVATTSLGLIERIRRGERDAFTPLFEKYRARLAVSVHYRLGPQMRAQVEVDDILQETLLRAFQEFERFSYHGPGSFMRWLSLISEHVIVDIARHHNRAKRHADELVPLRSKSQPGGADPADSKTPSRLLALKEDLRRLLKRLDDLPPQYREVLLLAKVEGLATHEIAERLGRSRQAVALLLHRALRQLRQTRHSGDQP